MSRFVEVDYYRICKDGEKIPGDIFLQTRDSDEKRIVCTLSDGLGSGVKANVLATLTATMGQKFTLSKMDIRNSAQVIMKTLPVCRERKISYSTFTMVDIELDGKTEIVEYDNPPYFLIREEKCVEIEKKNIPLEKRFPGKTDNLKYSELNLRFEDRLVFFSDGVSQSGIGTSTYPLGWREKDIAEYITGEIIKNSGISARDLSRKIVQRALLNDILKAKDDITCAVVYIRKPRKLLVLSGPPIDKERDKILVEKFLGFKGKKVICGGTTANIISAHTREAVDTDLKNPDPLIPPSSEMKGADLVTEGILTLSAAFEILKKNTEIISTRKNAASKLADMMLNTDEIYFLVGTKINEAHQDPNIPVDIGIRRTIINRLKKVLDEKYLKETSIEYI